MGTLLKSTSFMISFEEESTSGFSGPNPGSATFARASAEDRGIMCNGVKKEAGGVVRPLVSVLIVLLVAAVLIYEAVQRRQPFKIICLSSSVSSPKVRVNG